MFASLEICETPFKVHFNERALKGHMLLVLYQFRSDEYEKHLEDCMENMMKNKLVVLSATLTAIFTIPIASYAGQVPGPVADMLQQREQRLGHTTSDWQLALDQTVPAQPQNAILGMQRAMRKQFPGALDKNGVTNKQTRQRLTEDEINSVTRLMKGFSLNSINVCQIVRDGNSTLVTGIVQEKTIRKILEFYTGSTGMIVNRSNHSTAGRKLPALFPVAWGTPGNALDYREPFRYGFGLLPEHFSVLSGTNPLAMYGTAWDLVSTTPSTWVIKSHVEKGAFAPFSIQIVLDRKHDAAPSSIKVTGEKSSTQINVLKFARYNNEWISDKVAVSSEVPGIRIRNEVWTLERFMPSKPISVSLSTRRPIADYRLLGNNLTVTDALFTTKEQASNIVYYPWVGHFPDMKDLAKIKRIQHPGEATPDPSQSGSAASASNIVGSALPFAGGVLCLVGGVWMFKQRKTG